MNWQNSSFDWNRARALLATAEEGSFSAAARALGLTQSTLGRQVAGLEEELGVTLFEREGHRLLLTPTGLELVEQVRKMNEAAIDLRLIAAGQSQSIAGVVRVAASEAFSAYLLPPIVTELRGRYPSIEIELVVSNQLSDLRRREADIAVRHARPEGDGMIARLVKKESRAFLYGSQDYLERIGRPTTPQALGNRAEVVGFDESDTLRRGLSEKGLSFPESSFPIRTENHLVQWELMKQGAALCVMMEEVGDHEPGVERALPDFDQGVTFSTWLVSHRELKTNRRIRAVFDLLAELLTARLALRPPAPEHPLSATSPS